MRCFPRRTKRRAVGPITVDAAGLSRGLFFAARILLLVLGTSLVTLTTSPVALTDGLAQLMRPLGEFAFRSTTRQ